MLNWDISRIDAFKLPTPTFEALECESNLKSENEIFLFRKLKARNIELDANKGRKIQVSDFHYKVASNSTEQIRNRTRSRKLEVQESRPAMSMIRLS